MTRERNALAYTVGIAADRRRIGGRDWVSTRPVRVEVRAYVDEGEARRSELAIGFHAQGQGIGPTGDLSARARTRLLDDVRQSVVGQRIWPRRGRVQFMVQADESCWLTDLRLAMLVALHNATSDEVDLDPRAIWFGGLPRAEIGHGPVLGAPDFVDGSLAPYHAHALDLASGLGVDAWGPHGKLRDIQVMATVEPEPRPLPYRFALEAALRMAARWPVVVSDPMHATVLTSWATWLQSHHPTVKALGSDRSWRDVEPRVRSAVKARSCRAMSSVVGFPGTFQTETIQTRTDPPVDTQRAAAAFGVVVGVAFPGQGESFVFEFDRAAFDPSAPIHVLVAPTSTLSDTYDSDDAWVLPTEATALMVASEYKGQPMSFPALLGGTFRVVQE